MEQNAGHTDNRSKGRLRAVCILALGIVLGLIIGFGLRPAPGVSPQEQPAEAQADAEHIVWTCSMHPQVRLDKPGLCPLCNMDLISVTVGATGPAGHDRTITVSEAAKALMDIETTPVARKTVSVEVRMAGNVVYDERRVVHVTAWAGGRIEEMFVDFTGRQVRKGEPMVALYSPEIVSAQEELVQASRSLRLMTADTGAAAVETSKALVNAARNRLRQMGLTAEQVIEIENRGTPERTVIIHSPVSGVVVERNGFEGMYLDTGAAIYTIADLSTVWVEMIAYASDLPWLKAGQSVEFSTVSFPGESFTGAVSFIAPVVDATTRTLRVRVDAENNAGRLKPGMFVRALAKAEIGGAPDDRMEMKWVCPMHSHIVADEPALCSVCNMRLVQTAVRPAGDQPLVIPVTAPLFTGRRSLVYVRTPNHDKPAFEGRQVVLGPRAGEYYVVVDGLSEGELVVTRGAFKLDSELQLQGKTSMMSPEADHPANCHEHHDMCTGHTEHD